MKILRPEAGRVASYGIAILSVAIAFAVTYSTWPLLRPTPWAIFFAAVMVSAWSGGIGPSLLATFLSACLGNFYFFAPYRSVSFDRGGLVATATFLTVSLFIGFLASARRRAEAFERAERRRFQATATSIGDAVIATDAEGRVSFMNGIAEELTGWTTREAEGRRLEEVFVIVNEGTRAPAPNPVAKVLETGRIQGLANHTILISRGGIERPIDDSAAPIRDDGGKPAGVVLVFRDISERRGAEQALRMSEARHRFLADLAAATQPLTDPACVMSDTARLLAEHLGADRCAYAEVEDEATFVITGDYSRGVPSIVGRWPVAAFGGECARLMLANEPYVVDDTDNDPRIGPDDLPAYRATTIRAVVCVPLHKDGTFTAAMAVHQKSPRRWTPAEVELVTTVVGRCWEALERSRVTRTLRESEARFRAIVEATPECVKVVAPDGTLLQMNKAGLAMVEGDESAIGQCVYNVIAPEHREAFREFNERVCRGERGMLEFDIIGLNGTRRHMETNAVPLPVPEGGFTQLAVTRDATSRVRDAAALREKDERLKLLIENTRDYAVIISDPEGTVLEWQGGAERITGYSPGEAVGQSAGLLFTPEDRAEGRPEIEMAKATRVGRAEDKRWHQKKDGSRFYADGVMTALYDDEGRLRGFGKVFKDATREKQADEERRGLMARIALQARLFDTALSNTPDFIYTFDLSGRFTYVNQALLALWQKSLEDAVGKDFFDLDYPPELAVRLQAQIQRVIEMKSRVSDETPYTSAFGTRYYEYIFVPVFAPDGTVEAVAGSTRDVTERKQSEEATRRRASQLQRLAGIANLINAAHDVNSVITVVTEEARNLVGAHQAATSMVLDSHHPQPINVVSSSGERPHESPPPDFDGLAFYESVNRTNEPIRLTRREIDTGAAWRAMKQLAGVGPSPNGWLAAPLVGRNGRNIGLIQLSDRYDGEFTADDEAILVQLSQLTAIAVENARLYEALRGNDERKDEFLAMLAHELRNPLAAIGNAVKLTSKTDAREHIDWSIGVITRQMQHLSRLIDDLMDVSRITRGKIELRRDVLEVTPVVESAAATVKALVEERKHTLDLSIERGTLWVNVDPTRLEQVVVNLLNNAAKYSENAGHIRLSARNKGGEVVIAVQDRGVGIPPEKLPEMFELFAQGDRSLARSEGGLGIGLTVVKKLVEMHGGTIVAKSEGPGKGSEFVIRLPAAMKPSEVQPVAGSTEVKASKKARILVVDDNVDTARGMARLLKLIGHEVTTAHSGPEAIEAARTHRPEFVLLDIGLPGMSGYEVASQLRQEACCQEAVIVAVSGYGQDEDRRRSKQAGFDFHLVKPLDHDALLTLLSTGGNGRE